MLNAKYKGIEVKGIQDFPLRLGAFARELVEAKDSPLTIDHSP
jgi:hypothetical protein